MQIGELFAGLDVRIPPGAGPLRVTAVTEDSRTVTPGSLFVARKGENTDGRLFIPQAIDAGAVAVLSDDPSLTVPSAVSHLVAPDLLASLAHVAERFHGRPSSKLEVIGITGTNGKTTVAYLIHQALNAMGVRCGLMGTVGNDDGAGFTKAVMTTPAALEVSDNLARMVKAGCRAAVMETSSHALDQHRVGAVRFAAGVFTNLTHDHLDYHETMDAYAAAKAALFEMLAPDGVAVVNIMDPAHSRMVQDCKARIVRCAMEEPMGTRTSGAGVAPESLRAARIVGATASSTDVELSGGWLPGSRAALRLPLIGAFNVMNALEALAVVHSLFGPGTRDNLSLEAIIEAFAHVHAPPGRLEPVTPPGAPITVLVDYAHTDDALRTVLGVLRQALNPTGKLWCVFGCGGDRDPTKRPKMAAAVARLADRIVITSDNPRSQNPDAIIRDALAGVPATAMPTVVVEPDREAAIHFAVRQAAPGDVILIAGKGHEDYQIVPDPVRPGQTLRRHFDDREVAKAALRDRGAAHAHGGLPAAANCMERAEVA